LLFDHILGALMLHIANKMVILLTTKRKFRISRFFKKRASAFHPEQRNRICSSIMHENAV
jgi:hypothetical protein